MHKLTEEQKKREALWNAIGEIVCGVLITGLGLLLFWYVNTEVVMPLHLDVIIPLFCALAFVFCGTLCIFRGIEYIAERH